MPKIDSSNFSIENEIKNLKTKLGQLQEQISKASFPVSGNLPRESLSFMRLILRSSKNIYNLLSIMLHITPWNLMLMLHIRQSIYLVLTNVLPSFSSFFLHFWCSTLLGTCEAMICSYFGIKFLLFFMKIENTVYTSFQNSTLLFINELIFDIMNIQNN